MRGGHAIDGVEERDAHRFAEGSLRPVSDRVAVEEPLEIRAASEPVALTMRTPGDDHHLAVGFLWGEGIIGNLDDVGSVHHCGRPTDVGYGNAIDVTPGPGASFDLEALEGARRGTITTAACGVCGRRSIDTLLERIVELEPSAPVSASLIGSGPGVLAAHQPRFQQTGGMHAAAAVTRDGVVVAVAEDVGRHNAVDKVVGRILYAKREKAEQDAPQLLVVSGRVSFEIVQKAAVARIPLIAAVSAPTTLAVDLAQQAGICLVAFVRGAEFSVFSHPERVSSA